MFYFMQLTCPFPTLTFKKKSPITFPKSKDGIKYASCMLCIHLVTCENIYLIVFQMAGSAMSKLCKTFALMGTLEY